MLATLLQCAELEISEPEAKALCDAAGNVARHYDVAFLSQKTLDWTALVNTLAMVYGTRAIAIRARRSQARRTAAQDASAPSLPLYLPEQPHGNA